MEIGIALYSVELHGCLNGVYTNDGEKGKIINEIARIKPGTTQGEDGLSGDYNCVYFNNRGVREGWTLTINVKTSNNGIYSYDFIWRDENNIVEFEGVGYKMNERQIAVHYKYVGNK